MVFVFGMLKGIIMSLPKTLIERVKSGRVVLFLGSGALYGASLSDGKEIPLGDGLRDLLSVKFLGGEFKQDSLAHVSAMASSATSISDVQQFIANHFESLTPAKFHFKIPLFNWRAIFTTNYDRLVEKCYEGSEGTRQKINTILSNHDPIDNTRNSADNVPFLKLHGCVTRTNDPSLPMILTVDQYNNCMENRNRLFSHLYELAYENTIVFVGHSLQDANIRSVLLALEKEAKHGQRHYLLKPRIMDLERDFWAEKRITALDMTFEAFLNEVDSDIDANTRVLSSVVSGSSHPIQKFLNSKHAPSEELVGFLQNTVELVTNSIAYEPTDTKAFFKGADLGWGPIVEGVSITRAAQSEVFESALNKAQAERGSTTEFYVLKGEAGSGKTVLLRHLALQTATESLGVTLWVRQDAVPDVSLIEELSAKTQERIFLFWDNASLNVIEMCRLIAKLKDKKLNVTVLTAERYNEWNVRCNELDELLTEKYSLRYLSEGEISNLVDALEKFDSLGPNLIRKTKEERCKEFKDIHGRQLLVALHEATMGEPFEDIIFSEYSNIEPESARNIYLTVCVLNRFRVPVRAGLISRIHDVSFDNFRDIFYRPLEKVVISIGEGLQDVKYTARHPEIAEIVFRRALQKPEDRYREYINILSKLNISFSSDNQSYRLMIKAKSLKDLFSSHQDVEAIYKHAHDVFGDDSYLLQQMANYERMRPNGSFDRAVQLLNTAKEIAPNDSSILHSLCTVWRDVASDSKDIQIRTKARAEARAYLSLIVNRWGESSYVSSSFLELSIDNLRDLLSSTDASQYQINEHIRNVQKDLTAIKQKFPSDGHQFKLEAEFSELIQEHGKAVIALERSFEENDREPYLASRLSDIYLSEGNPDKARTVFTLALERRRANQTLNFQYAEFLRKHTESDDMEIQYYYRRAFTPNDRQYQAQFWFARFSYLQSTELNQQAIDTFNHIRNGRISIKQRREIKDVLGGESTPRVLIGTVKAKRLDFGFLIMDGNGYEVFFPPKSVKDDLWEALRENDRVSFHLGFSFSGPVAINITPT